MTSAKVVKKNGIGAPVRRVEDRRFLTGKGQFVDDMNLPNTAFAYVVRSPHAHARILRVDKTAALSAPGVLAVLSGEDVVKDKIAGLKCYAFPVAPQGERFHRPLRPILATEYVRHVGDHVAFVVAETLAQAKDAGELVVVDYEALPAVTLADALAENAPKVWADASSNVCFRLERGDRSAVDQKFSTAAHVTRLSLHYPRAAANTMEPRSVVAFGDGAHGRYTLISSSQTPYRLKEAACDVLGIPELNLRVMSMDVGGGFGMKSQAYPEDILTLWAARRLDRPVKWTAERSEGLASDTHVAGE